MIDIASGVGWLGMAPGDKATVVFQTGLTGSTGSLHCKERKGQPHEYLIKDHKKRDFLLSPDVNNHREHRGHRENRHSSVLSVYSVVDKIHIDFFSQNKFKNGKPQMDADKRRYTPVTEFVAHSNGSIHRKGRKERKAKLHNSLNSEEIIRTGTWISRITRIRTDTIIRVHPCDLCYILFKDSDAINNELEQTETNSGYSTFGG